MPHVIPVGALVTVPEPVPALPTVNKYVAVVEDVGLKVAVQVVHEFGDVWDVGAKNGRGLQRVQRGEIKRSGEEPAFACFVARRAGRPAEIAVSCEDN